MIRSTAMTATAGAAMAAAGLAVAVSLAEFDHGSRSAWLGWCGIAGCAATYGIFQLGRAHEAARGERNPR